jgi:hypothetical protein
MSESSTTHSYKFGGDQAINLACECGLVFSRQPMDIHGETRDVVAVWKENAPQGAPAYVVVLSPVMRTTESLIGCAVLALEYLGITRPRLGSIQRVAGVFAKMAG